MAYVDGRVWARRLLLRGSPRGLGCLFIRVGILMSVRENFLAQTLESSDDLRSVKALSELCPSTLLNAIEKIPYELWTMGFEPLSELAHGKTGPPDTDRRLRYNFWEEYERARAKNQKLNQVNIYRGACGKDYWTDNFLQNPARVAWMMQEPPARKKVLEDIYFLGVDEWLRILKMDTKTPDGREDMKLLRLKHDITLQVSERLFGKSVQQHNINQKTLQVNVTAEAKELENPQTPDQLDKRIQELESQLALPPAQSNPEVLTAPELQEKELLTSQRTVEELKRGGD